MDRFSVVRSEVPAWDKTRRQASVAMVFAPGENGKFELLFIKRADREGDPWSGHMAFPGGHSEPGDADLVETAIRETFEEIGLVLPRASFVGTLAELQPVSKRREVYVTPCVFWLPAWSGLSPGDEVAQVYQFAWERFERGEGRGSFPYLWNDVTYQFPCVCLEDTNIWGLTLRMIDDLLERLGVRLG